MFILQFYLVLVFAVFAEAARPTTETTETTETTTTDEADSPCNCDDQCRERQVIGQKRPGKGSKTAPTKEKKKEEEEVTTKAYEEEDSDGDGDRTICARDRDDGDLTFASVCHMMCRNRCTRYRVMKMPLDGEEVAYVAATRANFYKLYDGPC